MITVERLRQFINHKVHLIFYDDTRDNVIVLEVNEGEVVFSKSDKPVEGVWHRTYMDPKDILRLETAEATDDEDET